MTLRRPRDVRVLLTEGSSLTSREIVSCLGPLGYRLETLSADPMCLDRFSRWMRRVHRCPPSGADPLGYLQTLEQVVARRGIDVVLPTHEQAWLLASARPLLSSNVHTALADAQAFARVQSKIAFAQTLQKLGLPQPAWRLVERSEDLTDLPFPYWLKTPFSTAGQGVREVVDERSREAALDALLDYTPLMAQQPAPGFYAQVQGLFDRGSLIAVHTSAQRANGIGGSAAARISVSHTAPREHIGVLGAELNWHGGMTLDYLHQNGTPQYIECNPRTVEPGNATASGVNIAELQVRLTLGEQLGPVHAGRTGVRTHGTIAMLLGAAARGESRRSLLGGIADALAHRGAYADSSEQLTPLLRDPPSALAAVFVAGRIMLAPRAAAHIARAAVNDYALDSDSIARVEALVGRGAEHDP